MPAPQKHYAIFGVNTESNLEEAKNLVFDEIRKIDRATVSEDGSIQFDFQAYAFINTFEDKNEILAEIQSMTEMEMLKAQGYIQSAMLTALGMLKTEDMAWRDITDIVLADISNKDSEQNN